MVHGICDQVVCTAFWNVSQLGYICLDPSVLLGNVLHVCESDQAVAEIQPAASKAEMCMITG